MKKRRRKNNDMKNNKMIITDNVDVYKDIINEICRGWMKWKEASEVLYIFCETSDKISNDYIKGSLGILNKKLKRKDCNDWDIL